MPLTQVQEVLSRAGGYDSMHHLHRAWVIGDAWESIPEWASL